MAKEKPKKAIVIGAGLAGCSAAFAFLRRDIEVHLIEEKIAPAQMSSGNIAAVIMPHISASPDLRTRFSFSGFNFTNDLIRKFATLGKDCGYQDSGVLRVANSKRLETVISRLDELKIPKSTAQYLEKERASEILGIEINCGALFYPEGGFLSPKRFCEVLLNETTHLKTSFSCKINRLERKEKKWHVYDAKNKEIDCAEVLVIANANSSLTLEQTAWLPLEPVRGQVVHLPENERTKSLKSVLCYEGYITPAVDGLHMLGATYEHEKDEAAVSTKKTNDLISRLNQYLDKFSVETEQELAGRVGFRSSTPDRMPIIGMLNNEERTKENYTAVKYRNFDFSLKNSIWHHGLYVSLGHGSQGLISCPIAGELIASQACSEPLPLDENLVRYTSPLRFQVRELNRE